MHYIKKIVTSIKKLITSKKYSDFNLKYSHIHICCPALLKGWAWGVGGPSWTSHFVKSLLNCLFLHWDGFARRFALKYIKDFSYQVSDSKIYFSSACKLFRWLSSVFLKTQLCRIYSGSRKNMIHFVRSYWTGMHFKWNYSFHKETHWHGVRAWSHGFSADDLNDPL